MDGGEGQSDGQISALYYLPYHIPPSPGSPLSPSLGGIRCPYIFAMEEIFFPAAWVGYMSPSPAPLANPGGGAIEPPSMLVRPAASGYW